MNKYRPIKIALSAFLLCLSVFQSAAQQQSNDRVRSNTEQPCAQTLSDVPTVRGIRFGMSKAEAESALGIKMFGGFPSTEDQQVGLESLTFFRNRVNKYPSQLDGVEFVELKFFGNRLYSFTLNFDNSRNWENVTDFTASLSNEFKLPQNWKTDGSAQARMNCLDFSVAANIYFLPEISLTDTRTSREIESKRNEVRAGQQNRLNAKPERQ